MSAALAVADGETEIWIAASAMPYIPTSMGLPNPRFATFEIPNGVELYGGFRGLAPGGMETMRDQRDPTTNITTLSGDLARNDGPNFANVGENAYHVVSLHNADASTVLDGLRIIGGNANGSFPENCGGGLLVSGGAPRIIDVRVERSIGIDRGAGVIVFGGNVTFTRCSFIELAGAVQGGVTAIGTGIMLIENCLFYRNGIDTSRPIIDGPALTIMENVTMTVRDCDFIENLGECSGGALYTGIGPTVAIVERCRFIDNVIFADIARGGGIRNAANMTVIDSEIRGNLAISEFGEPSFGGAFQNEGTATLINCVMAGNHVVGDGEFIAGGAVDTTSDVTLINCTIAENRAPQFGGLLARTNTGEITVINSILWGNRAPLTAGIEASQRAGFNGGAVHIDYSCVEGLSAATGGVGNIGANPGFVDALGADMTAATGDEDVRLAGGSPCIDAGDNTAVPAMIMTDYRGVPRFLDDPTLADTGAGVAPLVDMGAYEHVRAGDLNCDGAVDTDDVALLVTALLSPATFDGCGLFLADIDGDGVINGHDVAAFVAIIAS